jgi:hypothetical protein
MLYERHSNNDNIFRMIMWISSIIQSLIIGWIFNDSWAFVHGKYFNTFQGTLIVAFDYLLFCFWLHIPLSFIISNLFFKGDPIETERIDYF